MNVEEIREYCLQKADCAESFPFDQDTLVFKVGGKIFALLSLEKTPQVLNLKCDPEMAVELREQYNFVKPGYHMNKIHWNSIEISSEIEYPHLLNWVDHSYTLVLNSLPKKERERISNL